MSNDSGVESYVHTYNMFIIIIGSYTKLFNQLIIKLNRILEKALQPFKTC